jgi:hypothetical protein
MPNIHTPGDYSRADHIMSSRTDLFFKRLDLDEVVEYSGDVESPIGFIQLVEVSRDMIAQHVATEGDPWLSERRNFDTGWYVTRQDSNGLIWAMSYGGDEAAARADYAEADAAHTDWLNFDEEGNYIGD